MRRKPSIAGIFVLSLLLMAPGLARAEWFIDPYLGVNFTSDSDLDVNATAPGVVVIGTFSDVNFEDSLLLGIRTGYWFPSAPNIGIGLDLFHYSPDIKTQTVAIAGTITVGSAFVAVAGTGTLGNQDIDVIGLTPELLLRLKLMESPDFPNGQVQPYASVGPAIFFIDADDYDKETRVGIQVGAGVRWMFSKNFGLFAEYRYMSASDVEFESTSGTATVKFEADFNSHSLLGGLSFVF